MTGPFHLSHRRVIALTGSDVREYLDRLLTVNVPLAGDEGLAYGALLTPQGKILHELFVWVRGDEVLIDVHADGVADLIKRLTMFKLRADVVITPREELAVQHCFDGEMEGLTDPRGAGVRALTSAEDVPESDIALYHATRIERGLPEQGFDYGSAQIFPSDVNLDRLSGVDYAKGCFVGQEVVSRMKRKGGVRKRTLIVELNGLEAAAGDVVTVDGASIGEITSVAGGLALARLRVDRLIQTDAPPALPNGEVVIRTQSEELA